MRMCDRTYLNVCVCVIVRIFDDVSVVYVYICVSVHVHVVCACMHITGYTHFMNRELYLKCDAITQYKCNMHTI